MALGDTYATVEELRTWAQIDDTVDDGILQMILSGVSTSGIEDYCHRQFNDAGTATARVYDVTDSYILDIDDFSTKTGLVVKVDTGNNGSYATTIASTSYTCYPLNGIIDGQIGFPFNRLVMSKTQLPWPVWIPYPAGPLVQVTAQWGWAAVPDEVRVATLIKSTRVFKRRYAPDATAGMGTYSFTITSGEDADVMGLLEPLERGWGIA